MALIEIKKVNLMAKAKKSKKQGKKKAAKVINKKKNVCEFC